MYTQGIHSEANLSDTLWRDALGAFAVLPIASLSSREAHAAAKPAAQGMSAVGIKRQHAAAAAVASVNRGYR